MTTDSLKHLTAQNNQISSSKPERWHLSLTWKRYDDKGNMEGCKLCPYDASPLEDFIKHETLIGQLLRDVTKHAGGTLHMIYIAPFTRCISEFLIVGRLVKDDKADLVLEWELSNHGRQTVIATSDSLQEIDRAF
jgi:hypothetical protein